MIHAVMYHYIREAENSNLRYLSVENFERQLDFFIQEYGILSADDWAEFLGGNLEVSGVLLTFDDGLIDHPKHVAPILEKKGLWGQFFVCTDPLEGKPLAVHFAHALLSKYPAHFLIDRLLDHVDELRTKDVLDSRANLSYVQHDHAADEKFFKRLINWATHDLGQQDATADLWTQLEGETKERFVERWYADPGSVKALSDSGFEVGSHTKTHRLLANLPEDQIVEELEGSRKSLSRLLGTSVDSFCLPFGGRRSYNNPVLAHLRRSGFRTAISVEPRAITSDSDSYELPRWDCNAFPFGKSEPFRLPRY